MGALSKDGAFEQTQQGCLSGKHGKRPCVGMDGFFQETNKTGY